jgi:hypothetical protein
MGEESRRCRREYRGNEQEQKHEVFAERVLGGLNLSAGQSDVFHTNSLPAK